MKLFQLGLLAVVIVAVGFWALHRTAGEAVPGVMPGASVDSRAVEPRPLPGSDASENGSRESGSAEEARRALGPMVAAGADFERGRVALQLRSAATGEPASGAQVLVGDAGFWETLGVVQELLVGSGELPTAWRASAGAFEADAEGRVDVPIPLGLALVAAEEGLERGFHMISSPRLGSDLWSTADATVWLEQPRDLEVDFVDQNGAPRADFAFGVGPEARYQKKLWVEGVADSKGRAWLHHFRTLLPKIRA